MRHFFRGRKANEAFFNTYTKLFQRGLSFLVDLLCLLKLFFPSLVEISIEFFRLVQLLNNFGFRNLFDRTIRLRDGYDLLFKRSVSSILLLGNTSRSGSITEFRSQLCQFFFELSNHACIWIFVYDSMILDSLGRICIPQSAKCFLKVDVCWRNCSNHSR